MFLRARKLRVASNSISQREIVLDKIDSPRIKTRFATEIESNFRDLTENLTFVSRSIVIAAWNAVFCFAILTTAQPARVTSVSRDT